LSFAPAGFSIRQSGGWITNPAILCPFSVNIAERHITDLYDVSSLFVTRTIVELTIEQLRNKT